jgi:hypothetical protein
MQLRIITVDFLYVRQNWTKFDTKHAKRAVSFRLKNNETYKTACFASQQNFAKQQVCFAKHETKQVSLETLPPPPPIKGLKPLAYKIELGKKFEIFGMHAGSLPPNAK